MNLTFTIVRKEFARFFGDRQLVLTAILMPGLLIYLLYSLMGSGMKNEMAKAQTELVWLHVQNMPQSLAPAFDALPYACTTEELDPASLEDKQINRMLVIFPAAFDSLIALPASDCPAPNVQIYYNSANDAVSMAFERVRHALDQFESERANLFDINRVDSESQVFNKADSGDVMAEMLGRLVPMLIMMLLFSGCMAIAPTAIAGEKERGTIATLLVTPLKRRELALGKILALSTFALLSGLSSFLGIILSLPKMMETEMTELPEFSLAYTTGDYVMLLLLILSTTLVMVSFVSVLSALAKDVKQAGTIVMPLMLVVMLCGLSPMLGLFGEMQSWHYLLPFYNNVLCMSDVLAFKPDNTGLLLTIGSNLAYMAVAVWGLTRMFGSEKIMFGK